MCSFLLPTGSSIKMIDSKCSFIVEWFAWKNCVELLEFCDLCSHFYFLSLVFCCPTFALGKTLVSHSPGHVRKVIFCREDFNPEIKILQCCKFSYVKRSCLEIGSSLQIDSFQCRLLKQSINNLIIFLRATVSNTVSIGYNEHVLIS